MPHYPSQEILFNDGEGIDLADLNGMQRFVRSQLADLAIGGRIRYTEDGGGGPSTGAIFAMAGGAGAPVQSAAARQLTNLAGVIAHQVATGPSTGAEPLLLVHRVAAGDLAVTLDVGDATHPRIDLVMVKLEHVDNDAADVEARTVKDYATGIISTASIGKRRKVRASVSVVKGTPAATPTYPTPPAGWALWCAVYVPASHNAVIDVDNIRDWRWPLGFDRHSLAVSGLGPNVWAASGWSALSSGPGVQSTAAGVLYIVPPARSRFGGRLARVTMMGLLSGCTVQLVRLNHDNTTSFGGETLIADISAAVTGGANQAYSVEFFTDATGVTVPIWLNGAKAGVATVAAPKAAPNDGRMHTLAIKVNAPSSGKVLRFIDLDVLAA